MNLKFYLRGLGIGMLVTAIIMLVISSQNKQTLTDEQIKQRAAELGMIDGTVKLSELKVEEAAPKEQGSIDTPVDFLEEIVDASEPEETKTVGDTDMSLDEIEQYIDDADAYLEEKNGEDKASPNEAEASQETNKPEPTQTPEPTPTPEPTQTPEPTATPESTSESSAKDISLTVRPGESSYSVAKELKELGLIDSADSFDSYLCDTGMDRRIYAGSYLIPEGTSEEDIARILTGKK